ncbi:MAG TPA: PASTA domain-containing protein [Dermatophilaceae bacterium]
MARVSIVVLVGMVVVSVLIAESVAQSAGTDAGKSIGIGVTAFLLFTAAATLGAALGFLFGLPRSRFAEQVNAGQSDTAGSEAISSQAPASTRYLTNSNLIKVCDWLTTIVIGLGLVNLGSILPAMQDLGAALKGPLGGASYAGAVGESILIGGALGGFLLVFMWTTIRFRQLLEDSERQLEKDVPSLIGMTVREAKEALGSTSLRLVSHGADREDAYITTQSLSPGATVRRGSDVKVTFAPSFRGRDIPRRDAASGPVPVQQETATGQGMDARGGGASESGSPQGDAGDNNGKVSSELKQSD